MNEDKASVPLLYMWCLDGAAEWAAGEAGGGGRKVSSSPSDERWSEPAWLHADDDADDDAA